MNGTGPHIEEAWQRAREAAEAVQSLGVPVDHVS